MPDKLSFSEVTADWNEEVFYPYKVNGFSAPSYLPSVMSLAHVAIFRHQ